MPVCDCWVKIEDNCAKFLDTLTAARSSFPTAYIYGITEVVGVRWLTLRIQLGDLASWPHTEPLPEVLVGAAGIEQLVHAAGYSMRRAREFLRQHTTYWNQPEHALNSMSDAIYQELYTAEQTRRRQQGLSTGPAWQLIIDRLQQRHAQDNHLYRVWKRRSRRKKYDETSKNINNQLPCLAQGLREIVAARNCFDAPDQSQLTSIVEFKQETVLSVAGYQIGVELTLEHEIGRTRWHLLLYSLTHNLPKRLAQQLATAIIGSNQELANSLFYTRFSQI